jgi:nitrogen fixation protein NifX
MVSVEASLSEHPSVGDAPCPDEFVTVAFATSDEVHVNEHFGSAEHFLVYAVSSSDAKPISVKSFNREAQDGNEDKLKVKLSWLQGGDVVVCAQVGNSAAQQLLRGGTQPIAVNDDPEISAVLEQLQKDMSSNAAWTRRLKKTRPSPVSSSPQAGLSLDEAWQEE